MSVDSPSSVHDIAGDKQAGEGVDTLSNTKEVNFDFERNDCLANEGASNKDRSLEAKKQSLTPGSVDSTTLEVDQQGLGELHQPADVTAEVPNEHTSGEAQEIEQSGSAPEARAKIEDDYESKSALEREVRRELAGTRPVTSKRKDNARKRLLQTASYAALVEDRIEALERALEEIRTSMNGQKAKEGDTQVLSDAELVAIALETERGLLCEPNKVTFSEFLDAKRTHVVDLLMERPIPINWNAPPPRTRTRIHPDGEQQKRVERFKINSKTLCDLIGDVVFPRDIALRPGDHIVRPFKALFTYHDDLLKRRDELENELSSKQHDDQRPSGEFSPAASVLPASQEEGADPEADDDAKEYEQTVSEAAAEDSKPYDDQQLAFEHLTSLLSIMENELQDEVAVRSTYRNRDLSVPQIQFDHLWHLFAPGDLVYNARKSQAYQVLCVHNGRELFDTTKDESGLPPIVDTSAGTGVFKNPDKPIKNAFAIHYIGVAFNGREFGPFSARLDIDPFEGARAITALELYPIEYGLPQHSSILYRGIGSATLDDAKPLRDALLERGRRYKDLANTQHAEHCYYRGMTLGAVPELVDSHVIIDTDCYYETHPEQIPDFGLSGYKTGEAGEVRETVFDDETFFISKRSFHDDRKVEEDRMNTFLEDHLGWIDQVGQGGESFNDDQLRLLPGTLWGFVLHSREWRALDVNKIQRVAGSKDPFNQLQIDPEYKKLVESQVTMHSSGVKSTTGVTSAATDTDDDRREDLVRGKGKGLIILLHGAPGVGKTSTAECVAEYTNRPLLSITCGDIGDTSEKVEKNLNYYLNLAHRWGCVMLLDEADVFLTTRDRSDMHRNAVVSVFLRTLEYYSGILFLTTNKVGAVDEAFKSRIHLSLYYPPLGADQTDAIWRINLERIQKNKPDINIDVADVLRWASKEWRKSERKGRQWNGRQIRNACQTAAALAEFDKSFQVTRAHLNAVANASSEFDQYLNQMYGMDGAQRARRNFDRFDEYQPRGNQRGQAAFGYSDRGGWDPSDDQNYELSPRRDNQRQSGFGGRRPYPSQFEDEYDSDRRRPRQQRDDRDYDDSNVSRRRDDREYGRAPREYDEPPSDRAGERPTGPSREGGMRDRPQTESRRANSRSATRDRDAERDRYRP